MSRGSGINISALFLSDMGLRTMNSFYMFAQRAGISVAFGAAGYFAYIGFLRNIKTNFFMILKRQGKKNNKTCMFYVIYFITR